ncbi:MAG: UDP-N-acetylglucosamine 2-epimerase [Candidatus Lokiarchaeota archaeon]|nr:UDP-N-acetylglucosamine 2-epimerase [Candidatus Harpocratesius repetitus]
MKDYCIKSNLNYIKLKYPLFNNSKFASILNILFIGVFKLQVKKILQKNNPNLIIQTNDTNLINNVIVSTAKKKNILTLVIQWAQTAPEDYYLKLKSLNTNHKELTKKTHITHWFLHKLTNFMLKISQIPKFNKKSLAQGNSDYVFVINDYTKKLLIKQGVKKEKIYISGSTAYDDALSINLPKREEIKKKIGINNNNITILFISQPFYVKDIRIMKKEKQIQYIKDIIVFFNNFYQTQNKEVNIILKLHPVELKKDYIELTDSCKNILILSDFNNLELIKISDLCVGFSSTLLQSVIIMKKPILCLNMIPELKFIIETQSKISGITQDIKSWNELSKTLKILEENGYQQLDNVNMKNFVLDQKVYLRLETWIHELLFDNHIISTNLEPNEQE